MRKLVSILMLAFCLTAEAQQIRVFPDTTGVGASQSLSTSSFLVLGPNDYLASGYVSLSPNYIESANVTRFSDVAVDALSKKFPEGTSFNAMQRMTNGDIVVAGSRTTFGNADGFVARFDSGLNILWSVVDSTSTEDIYRSVAETFSGSVVLAGTRRIGSYAQQVLVKLSSTGSLVWSKQAPLVTFNQYFDKVFCSGDSIIVFGREQYGTRDVGVRVFDSGGTELFHRTYGDPMIHEGFPSVVKTSNGYAIVASRPGGTLGLIKIDSNFDLIASECRIYYTLGLLGTQPEMTAGLGDNLYLGTQATDFSGSYSLVVKLGSSSEWATTLNSDGGFGSADIGFSSGKLVVPSAKGLDLMVSLVDSASGQLNGSCEVGLPTFVIEQADYVGLIMTPFPAGVWSSPGFIHIVGPAPSSYVPKVVTCLNEPMPIELTSFEARASGGKVKLDWVTASEKDNDYFTVERSPDGETFEEVVQVDGAGDSENERRYEAFDEDPIIGTSYYRLRQTDFDGMTMLSNVVAVRFEGSLVLYPNPLASGAELQGMGGEAFQVFDASGRLVFSGVGNSTLGLPAGLYVVRVASGAKSSLVVTN